MDQATLSIAVIEDDPLVQATFPAWLRGHDFHVFSDLKNFQSVEKRRRRSYDLILLDLCTPIDPTGQDTIRTIPQLRHDYRHAEIVVQSALRDVKAMREAVRQGAAKFILKDHLSDEIPLITEKISEIKVLKNELNETLVGDSPVMGQLKKELLTLKFESSTSVLIEGETGTGKELCARALAGSGPFVAINASAIPSELFESLMFGSEKGAYTGADQRQTGYLEAAANGTLFIDEIQSLPTGLQSKFLRALETRTFSRVGSSVEIPFTGRVISASNENLQELASLGKFREDLYYRIAPLQIKVPPLRMRTGDIPQLVNQFLKEFDTRRQKSFTVDAIDYLEKFYDWPGNVRELRSFIQTIAIKSPIPIIDSEEVRSYLKRTEEDISRHLAPSSIAGSLDRAMVVDWNKSFDENIEHFEKCLLQNALQKSKSEARNILRLGRTRFYSKLKKHGLTKQISST